jgi:hypothetical protein
MSEKPINPLRHRMLDDMNMRRFTPDTHNSGCSGVWLPPPKYRNNEACDQGDYLEADLYPVPDRRGISVSNPIRPVQNITIEVRDFSLDKAMPQFAAAIDAQIDRDDASDDFINEKLHANIRSSSADSTARP